MGANDIILAKGSHSGDCEDPERCLFEWYNHLASARHTDDCPPDVSRVLHVYGLRLNDALSDDRRQELKRFLPDANGKSVLSGTRDDGHDEARSYMALDWLIRTYTPMWLDLAGLAAEATALRDLRRIVDLVAAQQAGPVVREAQAAAGAAARDAAGAAAWAAARAAARDAAWAAAGDAARDAAGENRYAAGAAAWAAAWAAAGAALQPTVDVLQISAIDLFDRMVHPL